MERATGNEVGPLSLEIEKITDNALDVGCIKDFFFGLAGYARHDNYRI